MKKKLCIDVDIIIEKYNDANPEKRALDRKSLADMLGVEYQLLSDWKRGKTPSVALRLLTLIELGGCQLKDFCYETE